MSDTQKDVIILHLREIIRELEQEKKDLCKQLGLLYRPKNQADRDGAGGDPNGGTGETKGGASDAM